jgi:hypothetical protein
MIFDNTTPASVEVDYMGITYDAVLEGSEYKVLLLDYDTTGSVAITVNPALPDQDISAVSNNGQSTGSYVSARGGNTADSDTSPAFTVSAGNGYETAYTVNLEFGWTVDTTASPMDLKTRFGITTSGIAGVTEAFNAVHWLINTPKAGDDFTSVIQLGDWVDLDSLTVAPYNSDGAISATDQDIDPDAIPNSGDESRLLRLIVVGKNSFNGINGNNTPHVVFQFQNLPGTRQMNATDTNVDGYAASEMQTYLTGNFYTGLTAAGVPDQHVWAPSRRVWNGFTQAEKDGNASSSTNSTVDTITGDKLWLPTEWEMFGTNYRSSSTYEDSANQAHLVYYTDDNSRLKYISSSEPKSYWEASPHDTDYTNFCCVRFDGSAYSTDASDATGCAPAFCVK